jgi:hypothetical protein
VQTPVCNHNRNIIIVLYFGRHERAFRYKSSFGCASLRLTAGFPLQSLAGFVWGKAFVFRTEFRKSFLKQFLDPGLKSGLCSGALFFFQK